MEDISQQALSQGLLVANRIAVRWGCSPKQRSSIFAIRESDLRVLKQENYHFPISETQAVRISFVLNIHASLRTIFLNNENVYGYISMHNHNHFFGGCTPLSIIETGKLEDIEKVATHIIGLAIGN